MANDAIKALAQRAATSGLNLRNAKAFFDAAYRADALILSKNSIQKAAKLAGVNRECFSRQRRRDEIEGAE